MGPYSGPRYRIRDFKLKKNEMSSLLGHQTNLELLSRYVHENRPAHAYLFSGRQGIGKKKVAFEFARMVNCSDFEVHEDPLSCNTCRRILAGSHPDVHLHKPVKNMIRVDAIRSIISFLKYPPVEANFRIVIIDDAHLMNRSAQNALLKTLEEPPPNRIIILVSSQSSSLLPTVKSRIRRMEFGPLSGDDIRALLLEHKNLGEDESQTALAMACGSIERALSKSTPENVQFRNKVISCIFTKSLSPYRGLLDLAAEAGSDKSRTDDLLDIAGTVLRDALIIKLGGGEPLINADYFELIKKISDLNTAELLMSAYDQILSASEQLDLDINLSKNLVLDVTFLRIETILHRA